MLCYSYTETLLPKAERGSFASRMICGMIVSMNNTQIYVCAATVSAALDFGASRSCLNNQENQRLQRFIRVEDQALFLAAHCLKRWCLGAVLGEVATALRFYASDYGKPMLCCARVDFNLSHSGDWVVLAICNNGAVGVDVECQRNAQIWRDVIPQISAVGQPELTPLKHWTAKEAVLKALGQGLYLEPKNIPILPVTKGFNAMIPAAKLSGHWYAPDAKHLIAVACESVSDVHWQIADDRHALQQMMRQLILLRQ